MLIQLNLIFQQSDEAVEWLLTSAPVANNSSWACLLRFYPWFVTEPRFATEPVVLQTVTPFAAKPSFVTEPRFATVPRGTVLRNVRIRCDEMCGFSASKCANVVRLNMVGMVRRYVRVRCIKVCRYAAKCRNGATERGNPATERQRNGDHERQDRIIFANNCYFYLKTAFQSEALMCTIITGIKCKSWLKCCDSDSCHYKKGPRCLLSLLVHHQVGLIIVALLITWKSLMHKCTEHDVFWSSGFKVLKCLTLNMTAVKDLDHFRMAWLAAYARGEIVKIAHLGQVLCLCPFCCVHPRLS